MPIPVNEFDSARPPVALANVRQQADDRKRGSDRKPPRSGNRRNPHTHKAIIDATLGLLDTVRYPALTIEAVAAAAGVGKATVYRWWPSKGALVAEAIASTLTVEDPPGTGDLRADLIAAAEISIRNYGKPPGGLLFTTLAADLADDPETLQNFVTNFVLPRRKIVRDLVEQAIDEGIVAADLDADLMMDMWAGAVIYRVLLKHMPIDTELATQMVDAFITTPP